jgi:hypothetical protein
MRASRTVVLAVSVFTFAVSSASAQDPQPIEITPYVGIGTPGAPPVGTAITFPITSSLSLETDVAYRRGEGDMHALSSNLSLLYFLPTIGSARPYVAGGVGLAQSGTPVFAVGGTPIGTQSRLGLTVNTGGGVTMPVSNTMDLRTDARWFKTVGQQGGEQFRVSQGLSFDVRKR